MDTFYIDDPTLAFINGVYWVLILVSKTLKIVHLVNAGRYLFTYPEYLSIAIAKVWAGKADLPCTAELWRRYDKDVKDRGGYSKHFQLLGADGRDGKFCFNSLFLSINLTFIFRSCSTIFPRLARR